MGMNYLSVAGLLIIAAGWLMQYFSLSKGNRGIEKRFVLVYALGVLVLVADGFSSGAYDLAVLNLVTCGAAALVYLKAG